MPNSKQISKVWQKSENANTTKNVTKSFIYLTQTEECLPPNLASSAEIGDPESCNCDVIVLSYKSECEHPASSSHISYLFEPTTTWAAGRNVLFFTAMRRQPGYHFYILLDDDITLGFNAFTSSEMQKLQPFRVFEEWLMDYEPAFGVVDYFRHGASWTFKKREHLCGIKERSMVLPVVWFDGCLNAYHHKAVRHVLPYPSLDKSESWYIPNRHIMSAVELKFRGQAMMFVPVRVINPKHRSYPKGIVPKKMAKYWRGFIEKIREKSPPVYKNCTIWEEFKENLGVHMDSSSTYCMNATRHIPIVPYAHFERETLRLKPA